MKIIKSHNDFYTSVEKALDEINQKWRDLNGLIVLGSHMPLKVDEKIEAIREARENRTPFLGICFGMQLAAIEYARNNQQVKDATSEELGKGTHIVTKLPRLHVGLDRVAGWWGTTEESHWHNYSVNLEYSHLFQDWDISENDDIVEVMRLKPHPFFVGVQFHPEYQSSKEKPHPLLVDFINACKK